MFVTRKKNLIRQKCIETTGFESSMSTHHFIDGCTENKTKYYTCNTHGGSLVKLQPKI